MTKNVPVTVNVDTTEILEKIEELKDEETLKRDKEILSHIQHRYEEEERRFQTVDSKISSMIAVLIMIFTIQGSLFTNIVLNISFEKIHFKLQPSNQKRSQY